MQAAQQLREIAVARFRRRSLEGAAQGGHDSGMRGRHIDADHPPIQGQFRVHVFFRHAVMFKFRSLQKRANPAGSFVRAIFRP